MIQVDDYSEDEDFQLLPGREIFTNQFIVDKIVTFPGQEISKLKKKSLLMVRKYLNSKAQLNVRHQLKPLWKMIILIYHSLMKNDPTHYLRRSQADNVNFLSFQK